jgi:hypothetical protein
MEVKHSQWKELEPLVVCPVYGFTDQPLLFSPRLGGSGFDLIHLDPRAIDLFDHVLDGGAPDERLGVLVPGSHTCLDRLVPSENAIRHQRL